MIEPFSPRTANNLMRIASHPIITNSASMPNLPSGWSVLAKLSFLSAEDFVDAQERGLISADTSQRKAEADAMTWNFVASASAFLGDLPHGEFGKMIKADILFSRHSTDQQTP